ncbi:807_t:CDS:2, partial [Cetraspora pellucida]
MEFLNDETNALEIITSLLSNPEELGLIMIYINFIVESQLEQLTAYIEINMNAEYFGPELDTLIVSKFFQPAEFYSIFCGAFSVVYKKFSTHIPSHPGRPLFFAAQ